MTSARSYADSGREAARPVPQVRPTRVADANEYATRFVLRSLARRIEAATAEANELERELLGHVRALAPKLLNEPGVSQVVAAQLLVAWSHPGRLRSEACFAPISPASAPSPPPAVKPAVTASAAEVTASSTAPSTRSCSTAASTTPPPATTSPTASPTARAAATRPGSSSATSPDTSTDNSNERCRR